MKTKLKREKDKKYYEVGKINLSMGDDPIVTAINSRKALEQIYSPKEYKITYTRRYYDPANVCVTQCDERGYIWRDLRKRSFYQVNKKNENQT